MSGIDNAAQQLRDTLILVNEQDEQVGTEEKTACHLGDGILHRAFSVFLFDPNGSLLIQQRSENKMLWPLFWANSCCSHPRDGEPTDIAARRRIAEELGVKCDLRFLYKFVYQAKFHDVGSEYENCWVFVGSFDGKVNVDRSEIADYRFISPDELTREIAEHPDRFSPWLKLEWEQLNTEFSDYLP